MEISYNQIFDGVSFALHSAFPTVQVHGRTVKQDLTPGDFNVLPISASEASQIGTRGQRSITFDVIYYPPDTGSYEACLEIQDKLPDILDTITTPNGDKVHCLKFDCTITDDVLHCIVSYPHFVYRPAAEDEMETLTIIEK